MLKDILAISGQPGLYKLVTQSQKNIIVESLETKKRIPVYQSTKVSALDDIAIYTVDEEIPLSTILEKIYKIENKGACSVKKNASNNEIKEYFGDILPDYDKDRVYVSDMKKVLNWYNILLSQSLLNFEEKVEEKADSKEEKINEEVKPKAIKPVKTQTIQKAPKAVKTIKAPAASKKSVPIKK